MMNSRPWPLVEPPSQSIPHNEERPIKARYDLTIGCYRPRMSIDTTNLILAVATENAELRTQLAEAQDLLIETAVDAGHLHARIAALQDELDDLYGRGKRAFSRGLPTGKTASERKQVGNSQP
jgi:hypothetical protein